MTYKDIDFTGFEERKNELKRIRRYAQNQTMFYRTHLGMHARRVCWLVEEVLPLAKQEYKDIDEEKVRALALIHDDVEMVTGDVISPEKKTMSKEQKEALKKREEEAIELLAEKYPKEFQGYNYKKLLHEAQAKQTKEARLVNIADKFDAFGEALHEIFAGNPSFNKPQREGYHAPIEYYVKELKDILDQEKVLEKLKGKDHPMLKAPLAIDVEHVLQRGQKHTLRSIEKKTGYEPYDFWKQVTIEKGKLKGIRYLVEQKEEN